MPPAEALAVIDSQAIGQAGSPLPVFSGQQMAQALVAYKELQRALDDSMPDAIMQLDGKPYRKKSYWRAVAVAFNLSVEPIEERREVNGLFDDGRDNFGIVVTYRATAPNGRSATGDGACFAVEKAKRFKCPHPEEPDNPRNKRTVHFPPENCPAFDAAFQWKSLPAQSTEHNIRGHAHTRAYNRAVSNLVGFGEVSAEEVSRDEHTPSAENASAASEAPAPVVRPDGVTTVKTISEKSGGGGDTGRRAWTVTRVTFTDGRSGSTFDKEIAEFATKAKASGALVKPTLEQGEKGIDLTALAPAGDGQASPGVHPDDGLPVPEKVLTIRKASGQGGKEWAIVQGSEHEYVTDDAALAATLEQKKALGVFMVFQYDWVAGRAAGSWARKLKGVTDQPRPPVTETELPA